MTCAVADSGAGRTASGMGLATVTMDGQILDTWYPDPHLGGPVSQEATEAALRGLAGTDEPRAVRREVVTRTIDLDAAPTDVPDIYLRLHLLSHRLVRPGEVNLEGIFALLPTVVWTSAGPCQVDGFELTRARLRAAGREVSVLQVDKIPRMVDYVVPAGVRIADADRVRLGAHLAPGTTVMHEGFVNYNAGTLGTSMVEGRISQGVIVEDGADIGGGASIMGTLSGGGTQRVRVGARSLLGANAGLGISLGSDCVVEAGLYVTAGTKVTLVGWPQAAADAVPHATGGTAGGAAGGTARDTVGGTVDGTAVGTAGGTVVKALALSGQDGVLFRRNSLTGAVEAVPRGGVGITLNAQLHHN